MLLMINKLTSHALFSLVSLTKTAKKGLELKQKLIEEVSVICIQLYANHGSFIMLW